MEAFDPTAPDWTKAALHARPFGCPSCNGTPAAAERVWLNRRAPVTVSENVADYRRKWQEFYLCGCGQAWWAWSTDRPPSEVAARRQNTPTA